MSSIAAQPLAAETAPPVDANDVAPCVIHVPRPMSHDPAVIAQGRETALARYGAARSNAARMAALLWVNHWRQRHEHVAALKTLRLID